jgi:hypothetical protein
VTSRGSMSDRSAQERDERNEERSPVDDLIDLLVYAPLGLAMSASEELPKWVERGRQRVAGQVPAARAVGTVAVSEGQRRLERLAKLAAGCLEQLARMADPGRRAPGRTESEGTASAAAPPATSPAAPTVPDETTPTVPGEATPEPQAQVTPDSPSAVSMAPSVGAVGVDQAGGVTPSAAELAIPGYDALSAPHVVQRLAGLSPEELEAVRAYEAATRRRKTILTRIAQLQAP